MQRELANDQVEHVVFFVRLKVVAHRLHVAHVDHFDVDQSRMADGGGGGGGPYCTACAAQGTGTQTSTGCTGCTGCTCTGCTGCTRPLRHARSRRRIAAEQLGLPCPSCQPALQSPPPSAALGHRGAVGVESHKRAQVSAVSSDAVHVAAAADAKLQ